MCEAFRVRAPSEVGCSRCDFRFYIYIYHSQSPKSCVPVPLPLISMDDGPGLRRLEMQLTPGTFRGAARAVKRQQTCPACLSGPRNSRYGSLCTGCGKAAAAATGEDGTATVATPPRRSHRATTTCKLVGEGGIIKLPRGTLPAEILKKLDGLFLEGQLFWDKLERAAPRLVQEIGPGSAAWDESVSKLLLPWVRAQLAALHAPATMTVADSPTSVLIATVTESTKLRAGGGQLVAHQDYARSEYPGEAGWNFLVLMNDVDELEACQLAWKGSRDSADPTKGHDTRAWLDATFERVPLTGGWGTVYVFDCATWHAVERMRPRERVHATRSVSAAVKRSIHKRQRCAGNRGAVEVRARTSLVIDCRTAGLAAPHMIGDQGEQVWRR